MTMTTRVIAAGASATRHATDSTSLRAHTHPPCEEVIDRASIDDQIKSREGTRTLDEYAELLRGHTYLAT